MIIRIHQELPHLTSFSSLPFLLSFPSLSFPLGGVGLVSLAFLLGCGEREREMSLVLLSPACEWAADSREGAWGLSLISIIT